MANLIGNPGWWETDNLDGWSGVQGGGAKGLAYAGALRADQVDGKWFRAVAGSSAGALSAALVASGMTPRQMYEAVPHALGQIRRPRVLEIRNRSDLRAWVGHMWLNVVGTFGGEVGLRYGDASNH